MWQSGDLKAVWLFLLAVLVTPAGAFAADKAYISVDKSGQTLASDRPPSTGTVEQVVETSTSPESDAAKAQEEVQRINRKADAMAAERKQKQQERAAAKDREQRRQVSCAASRSRLEQLESQPPNRRLVTDPDGTSHRVTTEEMQELLSTARRQVTEDCGSLEPADSEGRGSGESRDAERR